ncbi:MAG: hypothetical protein NTV89_12070 [Proteobacteria bacterium]|nr:hypothetical protein [Pseudomonadota bacterium]
MLKESVNLYLRLFQFVKPHRRMLLLAGICMLPLALCSSGLAYLVKPALDDIFFKKNLTMLLQISGRRCTFTCRACRSRSLLKIPPAS